MEIINKHVNIDFAASNGAINVDERIAFGSRNDIAIAADAANGAAFAKVDLLHFSNDSHDLTTGGKATINAVDLNNHAPGQFVVAHDTSVGTITDTGASNTIDIIVNDGSTLTLENNADVNVAGKFNGVGNIKLGNPIQIQFDEFEIDGTTNSNAQLSILGQCQIRGQIKGDNGNIILTSGSTLTANEIQGNVSITFCPDSTIHFSVDNNMHSLHISSDKSEMIVRNQDLIKLVRVVNYLDKKFSNGEENLFLNEVSALREYHSLDKFLQEEFMRQNNLLDIKNQVDSFIQYNYFALTGVAHDIQIEQETTGIFCPCGPCFSKSKEEEQNMATLSSDLLASITSFLTLNDVNLEAEPLGHVEHLEEAF